MTLFQQVAQQFLGLPPISPQNPTSLALLLSIARGLDLFEGRSPRHAAKIALLSAWIAHHLCVSPRELTTLVHAALLHDAGLAMLATHFLPYVPEGQTEKQCLYRQVLVQESFYLREIMPHVFSPKAFRSNSLSVENATGFSEPYIAFTEGGDKILKEHPLLATEFIRQLPVCSQVAEIVAAHHERADGSGYPKALKGSEIPFLAAILALADVIESLLAEVSGISRRQEVLSQFFETVSPYRFDSKVLQAAKILLLEGSEAELRLKQLAASDIEQQLTGLLQASQLSLTGERFLSVITAFSNLTDGLLPIYTAEHSRKVALETVGLAQYIGVLPEDCGELVLAALLQNVGMLALPLTLLNEQRKLTPQEKRSLADHVLQTDVILKGLPQFTTILNWISETHERLNGSGYPGRLKGNGISVAGRLLAICDTYVALCSKRPYRASPYTSEQALEILGQGRFRLFDPQLVSVLRRIKTTHQKEMILPELVSPIR